MAKTDRIDATVLAHFAETVRPEARPLADEQARELAAIVLRRRQIYDHCRGQQGQNSPENAVRRRSDSHLLWLEKELGRVNAELEQQVRKSPIWREKDDLRSVPGVGPTLSATLLAELPELGSPSTPGARLRWWEWHL